MEPVSALKHAKHKQRKVLQDNAQLEAMGLPRTRDVDGLINHLLAKGHLDTTSADRARRVAFETGEHIEVVVTELGLISVYDMRNMVADFYGIQTVDAREFPASPILEDLLSNEFLSRNQMLPLEETESFVVMAICDPHASNELKAAKFILGKQVSVKLALRNEIQAALRSYQPDNLEYAEGKNDDFQKGTASHEDIQRLRDTASEAPVVRYINQLIETAVNERASDIHIEPMVDGTRVRFRIDGQLREHERLQPDMQAGVVSRIKILARLDIAERRLPQDGRTKFVAGGRKIDLRVSSMPVHYGESVVLRILDAGNVELSFSALGFDQSQIALFETILARPNGIILVTGPTGSGKTTTLYAALQSINLPESKLFTIEDPIEYELAGVNQIQAAPSIGLGFAQALRSILRQDPDIIMVGEMRDLETARIGIQAALTGHLVLSTLHTNSACTSVTRMLDIGIKDYLLGASLVAVVAQRLVRRLCKHCAKNSARSVERMKRLGVEPDKLQASENTVCEAVGCDKCHHTGYQGRTTLAEILLIDDELRAMITSGTNSSALELVAREKGMKTLLDAGLSKVLAGQTSLDEVLKVANL